MLFTEPDRRACWTGTAGSAGSGRPRGVRAVVAWRRGRLVYVLWPCSCHRRIYDLRHTYATWSRAAGDIYTLARRMGPAELRRYLAALGLGESESAAGGRFGVIGAAQMHGKQQRTGCCGLATGAKGTREPISRAGRPTGLLAAVPRGGGEGAPLIEGIRVGGASHVGLAVDPHDPRLPHACLLGRGAVLAGRRWPLGGRRR
jgi:hypothetical protein